MKSSARQLTPQEQTFVRFYLLGHPKGQAALMAGYSEAGAARSAHKLLQRQVVKDVIQAFYRREEDQTYIDRERIRRKLIALAEADPDTLYNEDWSLKPKSQVPIEARQLVISSRHWNSPTEGEGSAVKIINPNESKKLYLKFFPAPVERSAESLEDAAAEVLREIDDLIERMAEEDEEEPADGNPSASPP